MSKYTQVINVINYFDSITVRSVLINGTFLNIFKHSCLVQNNNLLELDGLA